ncbi:hypothetical protein RJ639_036024 [Escallonia herrerae]|uniref:Uncharacterized protein n=1 Tax=Escallonia herrerae TaxID=1293975 RepID=A0AA88WV38_9ASTE|nr:hypothetical protein RJ639_036024 [Escallonia herrerae]
MADFRTEEESTEGTGVIVFQFDIEDVAFTYIIAVLSGTETTGSTLEMRRLKELIEQWLSSTILMFVILPRKENARIFFYLLHAAYKTLSDPVLREEYNYELGLRESERACTTDVCNQKGLKSTPRAGLLSATDQSHPAAEFPTVKTPLQRGSSEKKVSFSVVVNSFTKFCLGGTPILCTYGKFSE